MDMNEERRSTPNGPAEDEQDVQSKQTAAQQPETDGAERAAADASPEDTAMPDSEEALVIDELDQERARSAEYLDQAQRARAELINYRRRTEQEMQQIRQHAGERLITRLLPVVDDFHRAVDAVPEEARDNSWLQGILLIERKLWSILESEGVRPIEAVGKPFDPSLHEAVTVDEGAGAADTVVEEFQRGYTLNGRVIRAAMVKVGHGDGRGQEPQKQ